MNEYNKNSLSGVKIDLVFKDNISFLKSYMQRIKQGGIFIKTETPLPLETPVQLNIKLPNSSADINADAVVVLSNPCPEKGYFPRGMAVRFLKIDPEDRQIIDGIFSEYKNQVNTISIF